MTEPEFLRAAYLTGATASGKTAVGARLAERLGAEVVALDSMTLYRGMDIGTAKPSAEERRGIPHHLLDVIDPWQGASVAEYRSWALAAAREIEGRGRRVLFVGGTALYLKALLRGLFEGPPADPAVREELELRAEQGGDEALHADLARVDPSTASRLHPNDRRRVVRAIEVYRLTGRPISTFQTDHEHPAREVDVVALVRPRPQLHYRIDSRVDLMFAQGLIDETRRLLKESLHPTPAQGVGYLEAAGYLRGEINLTSAIDRTKVRTRQFAKRQETWFRNLAEVRILTVKDDEAPEATVRKLLDRIGR